MNYFARLRSSLRPTEEERAALANANRELRFADSYQWKNQSANKAAGQAEEEAKRARTSWLVRSLRAIFCPWTLSQ